MLPLSSIVRSMGCDAVIVVLSSLRGVNPADLDPLGATAKARNRRRVSNGLPGERVRRWRALCQAAANDRRQYDVPKVAVALDSVAHRRVEVVNEVELVEPHDVALRHSMGHQIRPHRVVDEYVMAVRTAGGRDGVVLQPMFGAGNGSRLVGVR